MATGASNDDVDRITELRDKYVDAENAGDVEGILETCGEDIVFMPPQGPPVRGLDAAREFLGEFLDAFDITIELSRGDVTVEGDLAYEWGTVSGTLSPPDADPQPVSNTYLIVYERGPEGAWAQSKHIWNANE